MRNPFAGILVCGKCGGTMKRVVPDKHRTPTSWFRCSTRGCDCKIIKCDIVETKIHDAMRDWLEKYILQLNVNSEPAIDPTETALQTVRGQINTLLAQQTNICEYLEKGIYTVEMFEKRNTVLAKQIKQLQSAEADLLFQQSEEGKKKRATSDIIPTTQHILDNYAMLSTAEKNQLWKMVMKKAEVYRSPEDKLTVNIYPNLPK